MVACALFLRSLLFVPDNRVEVLAVEKHLNEISQTILNHPHDNAGVLIVKGKEQNFSVPINKACNFSPDVLLFQNRKEPVQWRCEARKHARVNGIGAHIGYFYLSG